MVSNNMGYGILEGPEQLGFNPSGRPTPNQINVESMTKVKIVSNH